MTVDNGVTRGYLLCVPDALKSPYPPHQGLGSDRLSHIDECNDPLLMEETRWRHYYLREWHAGFMAHSTDPHAKGRRSEEHYLRQPCQRPSQAFDCYSLCRELRSWKANWSFGFIDNDSPDFQQKLQVSLRNVGDIFCATPSKKPLFPASDVANKGSRRPLISAIGSWQSDMIELDLELLRFAVQPNAGYDPLTGKDDGVILVDDRDFALMNSGELLLKVARTQWTSLSWIYPFSLLATEDAISPRHQAMGIVIQARLVVMEGLLCYLPDNNVKRLLQRICQNFRRGELLFECINSITLQALNGTKPIQSISGTGAEFHSCVDDPKTLELLHPGLKLVESIRLAETPGVEMFPFGFRALMYLRSWIPGVRDAAEFPRFQFGEIRELCNE
ncbi:hypothetical protein F9C07_2285677 [Aspergillus flavus]|uniref:Uncharacterized protein n=1 Tax=Aspergillus flavus (strain ATCC 200026 / FGSC A1120 / IAM 13836 / NRRL 3357 / JCM 12722 / SRRC 167) TaxID=332952 RepID=A0A7U2R2K7_ASPFN|nr:hypothetical protein F9C07_2285677 [Aspergillus flavus]